MKNTLIPGKKTPSLKVDTLDGASWSIDDHLDKTKFTKRYPRKKYLPIDTKK